MHGKTPSPLVARGRCSGAGGISGYWAGPIGIAQNDWEHAWWVLPGSVSGMLVGIHDVTGAARVLEPESLVIAPSPRTSRRGTPAPTRPWRPSPSSEETVADPAVAGHPDRGPDPRARLDARTAGGDGTLRPGDRARLGGRLARWTTTSRAAARGPVRKDRRDWRRNDSFVTRHILLGGR